MNKKLKGNIIIKVISAIIASAMSTIAVGVIIGMIGLLIIGFNSVCTFFGISSITAAKIIFMCFTALFLFCLAGGSNHD